MILLLLVACVQVAPDWRRVDAPDTGAGVELTCTTEQTWFADQDGDAWGDAASPVTGCVQPTGTVANNDDCDDAAAEVNPDEPELCDGVDNNCDAVVDEDAVDRTTWYTDGDGDGFGGEGLVAVECVAPEGMTAVAGDCDDSEVAVYPGADEVCDGLDNDCDGSADLGAVDAPRRYADLDGDGFGDPLAWLVNCDATNGTVDDATDCDDHDATVNPAAPEVCDGEDQDCDEEIDEEPVDAPTWYIDVDGDGFGSASVEACEAPPGGVSDPGDCDDADPTRFPGVGC